MSASPLPPRFACLLVACVLAGCALPGGRQSSWAASQTSLSSSAAGLDDPQIAQITRASLTAVSEESLLAANHATSPRLRDYARRVHDDYAAALAEAQALFDRDRIAPQSSATSLQITDESRASLHSLATRQGEQLDEAFLLRAMALQQRSLDQIDLSLVPAARQRGLRTELLRLRPLYAGSLNEARALAESMLTQP